MWCYYKSPLVQCNSCLLVFHCILPSFFQRALVSLSPLPYFFCIKDVFVTGTATCLFFCVGELPEMMWCLSILGGSCKQVCCSLPAYKILVRNCCHGAEDKIQNVKQVVSVRVPPPQCVQSTALMVCLYQGSLNLKAQAK